jgi:hypothetical protein
MGLEVPESSTSFLFLLLLGDTAEGGEWPDSQGSDSDFLEEVVDL